MEFISSSETLVHIRTTKNKQTLWSEYASKLYRPSDHRLSAKLEPTFADRCHVVSVTDPYGRNLGFLDRYTDYAVPYISEDGKFRNYRRENLKSYTSFCFTAFFKLLLKFVCLHKQFNVLGLNSVSTYIFSKYKRFSLRMYIEVLIICLFYFVQVNIHGYVIK
jgi:hypothetical protein